MTIAARRATPKAFAEPSLSGFYSHLDGPAALVNMALIAEEARLQTALQCISMSQCQGRAGQVADGLNRQVMKIATYHGKAQPRLRMASV